MKWLYNQQFEIMVERWRSENLGQEPDDKIIDTLMALIESPQVCLPKIPTCERLSA